MTILFAGGEDSDFSGVFTVSTDTTKFRSAYARCALLSQGTVAHAKLPSPVSAFWVTGRCYFIDNFFSQGSGYAGLINFYDAQGVRRLCLALPNTSSTYAGSNYLRLFKADSTGAVTQLATANILTPGNVLTKYDVRVNYAVAGTVEVYINGSLVMSYSGDVTTNSATSLADVGFGALVQTSVAYYYWSEIVIATEDTRSYALSTLAPVANGNAFQWNGATSDINEVTLNDASVITSTTAGQIAQSTVAGITGSPAIAALVINARAQKGGAGPTKLDGVVRVNGTNYSSSDIPLSDALDVAEAVFTVNPATGLPWTAAEINAAGFNIGVKSVT